VNCTWCGDSVGRRYPGQLRDGRKVFCPAPRRCAPEAQRALPNVYWRLMAPEYLPMRQHLPELKRLRLRIKEMTAMVPPAEVIPGATPAQKAAARKDVVARISALSPELFTSAARDPGAGTRSRRKATAASAPGRG
jgi:hypothetical protein